MAHDDEINLLRQARTKAQRLVDELEQQALKGPARRLDPEQLQQGQEAMRDAVAAARRTLAAIEAAIQVSHDLPEKSPEDSNDDRDRS